MREKRTFAQRSIVLESREAKKKYFLVYEGEATEQIYFEALIEHRDEIGINPLIELVPVVRSYSESGWSNPKKILDRVLLNLEEDEKQIISYETLLNWIMEYLYDTKILTTSRVMARGIWNILSTVCQNQIGVLLKDEVKDIQGSLELLLAALAEETETTHLVDGIPSIIKEQSFTYDAELDKICFIIDRDRKSFISSPENDQYGYVLNKCLENGFGFYLSNPCFEFWLLLHFDEVLELDKDKLLANEKTSSKRRFTEQELRRLLPGYSKSKYDSEELLKRIDKAVVNEKQFCENDIELEYSVGSKVGMLVEELRK